MSENSQGRPIGVLLVGHGTRDETGTAQFHQLAKHLTRLWAPLPVRAASLEFQQPTIQQAWSDLVDLGVRHIHVAPLLLFAAGHAKSDIPDVLRTCQAATPHVSFDQSRPLSRHRLVVDLIVRRVRAMIQQKSLESTRTTLVLVGRGNRDVCAQADLQVMGALLERRVKVTTVPAFYAMAQPRLPEVLRQVANSKPASDVIVHPHLLFAGRLISAIRDQVNQASEQFRDINFHMLPYLGPDPDIAQAITDRIQVAKDVEVV